MKKYYVHDGIHQSGPFDIEELKEAGLQKHSQIWFEGLHSWSSAENFPELKDFITGDNLPPPFYELETPLSENDDSFYVKRPRNLILTLIMIIVSFLMVLWLLNHYHSKFGG